MAVVENESNTYREAVAAEVRALMARRRIRQPEIARVLAMSQPAVSRRLNAELAFDTDDIFALARYFDVRLSALLPEPAEVASDQPGRQSAWFTAVELPDELAARRRTTSNVVDLAIPA